MQDLSDYRDQLYKGQLFMIVYGREGFPKLTIGVFEEFPDTKRPVVTVSRTVSYHAPITLGHTRIPRAIERSDTHELLRIGERIWIGEQRVRDGLSLDKISLELAADAFKFNSPEKEPVRLVRPSIDTAGYAS